MDWFKTPPYTGKKIRFGVNQTVFSGAPDRTRICNLLLRKQTLYPIELRGHFPLRDLYDTAPRRKRQGIGCFFMLL